MAIQGKKIPQKTWNQFLEIFSEKASSISATAKMMDISPHAVYDHCRRDPEFAAQLNSIRDSIRIPFAEDMLFSLVGQGNLGAIKFLLARLGGKRWNNHQIIPLIIKSELNNASGVKKEEQCLPTLEDQIAALAYEEVLGYSSDKLPNVLSLDIRQAKKLAKQYSGKDSD